MPYQGVVFTIFDRRFIFHPDLRGLSRLVTDILRLFLFVIAGYALQLRFMRLTWYLLPPTGVFRSTSVPECGSYNLDDGNGLGLLVGTSNHI